MADLTELRNAKRLLEHQIGSYIADFENEHQLRVTKLEYSGSKEVVTQQGSIYSNGEVNISIEI